MEHILTGESRSSRLRRKVDHACVYCRRSHMTCDLERPCARCIKRKIGHLCHDEPREPSTASKKIKCLHNSPAVEDDSLLRDQVLGSINNRMGSSFEHTQDLPQDGLTLGSTVLPQGSLQIVEPSAATGIHTNVPNDRNSQYMVYSNTWPSSQSDQFNEMHNFHPSYMFNVPEVSTECNLLNDFLNNNLLDDRTLIPEGLTSLYNDQSSFMLPSTISNHNAPTCSQPPESLGTGNMAGNLNSRPTSEILTDKAREYYLQAADPSGNDAPEERMQRLLQAKYDAGLLKPFNYIKGYARLSTYMDGHLQPAQKIKILRQLERFRPKFREKVQELTDIQLIRVEMWFERRLMMCDRQFASMALPACCWRRTGEIFRGNKEMAELIHVPTENLRDGKISLHEILDDDSLVTYWEIFGAVAIEKNKNPLFTSCYLKKPGDRSHKSIIKYGFGITIERDENNIPTLIIGYFLPTNPVKH